MFRFHFRFFLISNAYEIGVGTRTLLVHQALNGQSPSFVAETLLPVTEQSTSDSQVFDKNGLIVPRTTLKFGKREFSVAAGAP